MGKPIPGWTVDVLDDEGNPTDNDTVGGIAVKVTDPRPLGLFSGYVGDLEADARAFRHGWYYNR